MAKHKKGDKVKVTCPGDDCNNEVEVIYDENMQPVGTCSECGLNVGTILNRDRHERALSKLREAREEKKEKPSFFNW